MSETFGVALLAHVRSSAFNVQQVRGSLTADQAKNTIEVFLLIYRALLNGGNPTRNAGLVAAKLGETGYGTAGANAVIKNWFSAQPARPGNNLSPQERARIAAFERLDGFEGWRSEKRAVDDTSSAAVRNPQFSTTDAMVAAQLFLVYGLGPDPMTPQICDDDAVMFPKIGEALRDANTKYTALQFGLVVQNAGYGPGSYDGNDLSSRRRLAVAERLPPSRGSVRRGVVPMREDVVSRVDISDRSGPVAIEFRSSCTRYCLHRGDLHYATWLGALVDAYRTRRSVRFSTSDDVFGPRITWLEDAGEAPRSQTPSPLYPPARWALPWLSASAKRA